MSNREIFEFTEWAADNFEYMSEGLWMNDYAVVVSTEQIFYEYNQRQTTTIPINKDSANQAINSNDGE
jgi:hypothetical protein